MARGKNSRRRASLDHGRRRASLDGAAPRHKGLDGAAAGHHGAVPPPGAGRTPAEVRDAIEFHWKNLSLDLKRFLLASPQELSLRKFVDFWTAPSRRENTSPNIAASICGCSWYLALNYMSIGQIVEARALILNGCFLQQCYNRPVDEIAAVAESVSGESFRAELPFFADGLLAISSRERIMSFLNNKVSSDYQRRMSFATRTTRAKREVKDYVDQISSDWGAGTSKRAQRRKSLQAGPPAAPDAGRIDIRLVDARTGEATVVPHDAATPLKALFKQYAEDRGTSLRRLRFSHKGRPLFLSTVGHKAPQDLGIGHRDDVVVTDAAAAAANSPEDGAASSGNEGGSSSDEDKARADDAKEHPSRRQSRRQSRRASWAGADVLDAGERDKLRHSAQLSEVFAEAAPRFARTRQRLNALGLACRPPKVKAVRRKSPVEVAPLPAEFHNGEGTGGKAGVPFYAVHVGAAENLYLTQRPTAARGKTLSIDLHGLTREEARAKLDAALPGWVETAMCGAYPWVVPATIVCGGGSQVLAEAVEGWIKEKDCVARAPRRCSRRRSI